MKVVLTADAKRSLARTIRTLARIYSKGYLTKLKKQVDEQVDWLADHPLAGAFEPELEQLGQGHRRWVVGPIKLVAPKANAAATATTTRIMILNNHM